VSYHELSTLLQQNARLVKKFLNLFEKTYILRLVRPFYSNKRTELVKNPKIYFVDTGLRNSITNDFRRLRERPDRGALIENYHYSEFLKADREAKYWRTKSNAEVDFVVDDRYPVEVKSTLARAMAGKSLRSYIGKYAPEKAFVFNDNLFDDLKIGETPVSFLYHFAELPEGRSAG
jgi:predicted AAA+ superfamily ATPase